MLIKCKGANIKIDIELVGSTTYVPVNGKITLPPSGKPKPNNMVMAVKTETGYRVRTAKKVFNVRSLSDVTA